MLLVFMVGGSCGCVEACRGRRDVGVGVVVSLSVSGLHHVVLIQMCGI